MKTPVMWTESYWVKR